jgi:C-terminal processing protease CtpA/Prc
MLKGPDRKTVAVAAAVVAAAAHNGEGAAGSGGGRDDGIRTIDVVKTAGGSLGLSFASDHDLPDDPTPTSHTIAQLVPGGAVAAAGALVGGVIVAIDGTFVTGRSHEDVTAMFQAADVTLTLTLRAASTATAVAAPSDTPVESGSTAGRIWTVDVVKAAGGSLGLSFVSEHDFPDDPEPTSHTIVQLVPGGAVATAGAVVGDTIIAINGTLVTGRTQDAVNALFKAAGAKLRLTLQQSDSNRTVVALATGAPTKGGVGAGRRANGTIRTVAVTKAGGAKLGLSIVSGHVLPTDPTPETHTIVELVPGWPAAAAGVVVGDTVVAIDGVLVTGRSHENVNALFKATGDTFELTLQSVAKAVC